MPKRTSTKSTKRRQLRASKQKTRSRPVGAFRQRGNDTSQRTTIFYAQEDWHEPTDAVEPRYLQQAPGDEFLHPVTLEEVKDRVAQLPERFTRNIEVIQLSRMTKKRSLFPCYGMQWGPNVYLYPIEAGLVETFIRPPRPDQVVEANMFGGRWVEDGDVWRLYWTASTIRDYYLNNVLIHEIGHVNDLRNTNFDARERYANWFAIEYGYRVSRGRRRS